MADLAERRKDLLDSMMRDAIYEGAVAVLSSHGLNGATMDRVAAAAGVAKGTLYNHFRNKRDLLLFVHARTVEPLDEATDEIIAGEMSAIEKLTRLSRVWREELSKRRVAFEFLIRDSAARDILMDDKNTGRSRAIRRVARVIEQGIQAGEFRSLDPLRVGEIFVGATIGMTEEEFVCGEQRSHEETTDVLIDVFLNGLVANQGSRGHQEG